MFMCFVLLSADALRLQYHISGMRVFPVFEVASFSSDNICVPGLGPATSAISYIVTYTGVALHAVPITHLRVRLTHSLLAGHSIQLLIHGMRPSVIHAPGVSAGQGAIHGYVPTRSPPPVVWRRLVVVLIQSFTLQSIAW